MDEKHHITIFFQVLNELMKRVLIIGQSSLSEHQYQAFRKMVLDIFADGKRDLGKGWCGDVQDNSKEGVPYG